MFTSLLKIVITTDKSNCFLLFAAAFFLTVFGHASAADTTYVRFSTTLGNIDVQLLSDEAPNTVANFLTYVDSGAYYATFIHRSLSVSTGAGITIFQGGGYDIRNGDILDIPTNAPVANEFNVSNTRGTLAMALSGGAINSATNQWFFNDIDNSAALNPQKYTVFGRVANAASLAVMDALSAVPVPNPSPFGSPFNQIPLINYVAPNVTLANIVYVNSIVQESAPVSATVALSNLTATSTGAAQGVTVTTNPPGLGVLVTYNGSLAAPSAAGTYNVAASITDPGYTGSATGTLVIGAAATKKKATVTLSGLKAVYNGYGHAATATTKPVGLAVTLTYNGGSTTPTIGGSYPVVATINDSTYTGSAKGTLVISKIAGTVAIPSSTIVYDGNSHAATSTTTPPGLPVNFTYNGKATVPVNVGTYAVVGTISDPSYQGTAKGTLVITKSTTATVTLGPLAFYYNGLPQPATATTNPANLKVTFTYNGKSTVPVNVGSYAVVATIDDPNYTPITTSGTLTIGVAPAMSFVGASGAEVSEGLNPNGVATTVSFQYGTTTDYGDVTPPQNIGSGKVPVNFYALFPGLLPGMVYHYRLVTVTAAGTVYGPDETFTTLGFETALVAKQGDFAVGSSGPTLASFGNPAVN